MFVPCNLIHTHSSEEGLLVEMSRLTISRVLILPVWERKRSNRHSLSLLNNDVTGIVPTTWYHIDFLLCAGTSRNSNNITSSADTGLAVSLLRGDIGDQTKPGEHMWTPGLASSRQE